jgi:hypothetical protein
MQELISAAKIVTTNILKSYTQSGSTRATKPPAGGGLSFPASNRDPRIIDLTAEIWNFVIPKKSVGCLR